MPDDPIVRAADAVMACAFTHPVDPNGAAASLAQAALSAVLTDVQLDLLFHARERGQTILLVAVPVANEFLTDADADAPTLADLIVRQVAHALQEARA